MNAIKVVMSKYNSVNITETTLSVIDSERDNITLNTGTPASQLRKMKSKQDVFSFDMREKGAPSGPKGLPKSGGIEYTVFINKKQFSKLKIEQNKIRTRKFLIQGEPTLNVPLDECPGEIGVVCFQAQVLPTKKEKQQDKEKQRQQQEKQVIPSENS